LAFSPDGKLLASAGASNDVKLWDVATGKELQPFEGHTSWVRSAAFSPDGRMLASVGLDDTVRFWEVATRRKIASFPVNQRRIHSVTFSHDGQLVATAGMDWTVKLWDTPKTPAAMMPSPPAQGRGGSDRAGILSSCRIDIQKFCGDEDRVGQCLRRNEASLSAECKATLAERGVNP